MDMHASLAASKAEGVKVLVCHQQGTQPMQIVMYLPGNRALLGPCKLQSISEADALHAQGHNTPADSIANLGCTRPIQEGPETGVLSVEADASTVRSGTSPAVGAGHWLANEYRPILNLSKG